MRLPTEPGVKIHTHLLDREFRGDEMAELRRAVDFGLRHLGLPADIGLDVALRPANRFGSTRGSWCDGANPLFRHHIILYLRRGRRFSIENVFVLFHEMAHMRQFATDAMSFGRIGGATVIRWKGVHYDRKQMFPAVHAVGPGSMQYDLLPWEMDANRQAYDLITKFYAADYIEAVWPAFHQNRAETAAPVEFHRALRKPKGWDWLVGSLLVFAAGGMLSVMLQWAGWLMLLGAGGMFCRAAGLLFTSAGLAAKHREFIVEPAAGEMFRESDYHVPT